MINRGTISKISERLNPPFERISNPIYWSTKERERGGSYFGTGERTKIEGFAGRRSCRSGDGCIRSNLSRMNRGEEGVEGGLAGELAGI